MNDSKHGSEANGMVFRTKPLPTGPVRGNYLLSATVLDATREALVSFALAGIAQRGHEGIAFWAGQETESVTAFLQCLVPTATHGPQGVFVDPAEVGRMSRTAREQGLCVLAQVHSHPGADARHSDGDDELIVMPYPGMLSIVVPHFGIHLRTLADCSVHQFQEGRWVLCDRDSIDRAVHVVDAARDLR